MAKELYDDSGTFPIVPEGSIWTWQTVLITILICIFGVGFMFVLASDPSGFL